MLHFIPMFGVSYLVFILAHMLGYLGYLVKSVPFSIMLPSGIEHTPTWGIVVIILGVLMLVVEVLKSTLYSEKVIIDHVLSTFTLIAFIYTYITSPWAGSSVFLVFLVLSMVDVLVGFSVSIQVARRAFRVL